MQASRGGNHVAVLKSEVGAKGGGLEVQIDRPVADMAAAGQRHHRPATTGQQRPEHAEASPHPPHESLRCERAEDQPFPDSSRGKNNSQQWGRHLSPSCRQFRLPSGREECLPHRSFEMCRSTQPAHRARGALGLGSARRPSEARFPAVWARRREWRRP